MFIENTNLGDRSKSEDWRSKNPVLFNNFRHHHYSHLHDDQHQSPSEMLCSNCATAAVDTATVSPTYVENDLDSVRTFSLSSVSSSSNGHLDGLSSN